MRKLLIAGAVTAAVSIAAVGEAGAAGAKKCGNLSARVGNIKAYNVSCKTAKKVAKADSTGRKTPGWKCTSKQYNAGANVTCKHKGSQKVTYQYAD